MRNPHCGWGWGMREAGIRSWGGHWGDLQPQICRGPGPKSSKLPLPTEWGSSLDHLLTRCSVNLSSSPRPKTSELRGSSLYHHLLTLVNFYQLLARTSCSGQLWIWPRPRFLTLRVILVPSALNFKPPSCLQYSEGFLLLFQMRIIVKRAKWNRSDLYSRLILNPDGNDKSVY